MKLFLTTIFCATVIAIQAAPQSVSDGTSNFITQDDVAIKLIAEQVRTVEKMADDNQFASAVLKSIDQKCMLSKYKMHNLLNEMLTEEALDLENIDEKPLDPLLVFANIALTCSNKLNAVLGFIFDNVFSYSGLIEAFREVEPFKEIFDEFVCYNNYAVHKDLLDPSVYTNLNYNLINETVQAECNETVLETRMTVVETLGFFSEFVLTDQRKCIENELATAAEKFFLKYILLVPLGLSDDQKKQEKVNFINDALDGLEKLLVCNIKTVEVENPKENEISGRPFK